MAGDDNDGKNFSGWKGKWTEVQHVNGLPAGLSA